ncbi:MAG: pitrilysin family protein [Caldisericia bacterium]|nr:pitrilysin family protein [Caldisericia bacterium]
MITISKINPNCFLLKQKGAHTFYIKSSIFAGSRFEPVGKYGLAHLCEHLLTNEIDRSVLNSPDKYNYISETNGMVEREFCNYWIKTTLPYSKRAMLSLASLFSLNSLSITDFENEKQVITGAAIQHESTEDPYYLLLDSTYDALYGKEYQLSHTELGFSDTCKSLTFSDYNEFYEKYYKNGRKVIVFYGDIEEKDIDLNLIDQIFSKNEFPEVAPLPLYNPQKINIEMPIGTTEISIATRIEKANKISRHIIIDLCGFILGKIPQSILYKILRTQYSLVYDTHTRIKHYIDTSIFIIYLGISEKNLKTKAIDLVFESLKNIQNFLREDEFEVYKEAFCERYLMNFDNPTNLTNYVISNSILDKPVYSPIELIHQIKRIKYLDMIDFFNKYLNEDKLSVVIYN